MVLLLKIDSEAFTARAQMQPRTKVFLPIAIGISVTFVLINYIFFLRDSFQEINSTISFDTSDQDALRSLHNMITTTNGFYARDWSLWLGWNNVSSLQPFSRIAPT